MFMFCREHIHPSIQEHASWFYLYSAYERRNEWAQHLGSTVRMKGRMDGHDGRKCVADD